MEKENVKEEQVQLNTKEIELPKIEFEKYIGQKVRIAVVEERKSEHGYYVFLKTTNVDVIGKGKEPIELYATKVVGLQEDSEGQVGWTKESKLGVLLAKHNAQHYNDLIGVEVIVQCVDGKDGRQYLTF